MPEQDENLPSFREESVWYYLEYYFDYNPLMKLMLGNNMQGLPNPL